MKVTFLGAAGTVTGSKFLLQHKGFSLLIDCGLFQGIKNYRLKNWKSFPVQPDSIDAVLLTHAHIDHSGYIPKLVKDGFKQKIYCTPATFDLCKFLLPDCGFLQEEDADFANKKGFSKHHPALPLYTEEDAEVSLQSFSTVEFLKEVEVGPFKVQFHPAGHILGASWVRIQSEKKSIVFSGDLGRFDDLLIPGPAFVESTDVVVMESTYGDRNHPDFDTLEWLKKKVEQVLKDRSVLLIPSFAVGRAQSLLFLFYKLFKKYPNLKIPLYLNSPMATSVTALYQKYKDLHKMDFQECSEVCQLPKYIRTVEESKELNEKSGPMVIISASGMITGGRILHHLKKFASDPKNIILLPGYQAAGTRGASLRAGVKQLKIHGEYVPVHAQVDHVDSLSAHGDQGDLLHWLKSIHKQPQVVYLVHGEPAASDVLRLKIQEQLKIETIVAEEGQQIKF